MPILIAPPDSAEFAKQFVRRRDGFDPAFIYQMIPDGATREMNVETGVFQAELAFEEANLATMSNFRVRRAVSAKPFSLPGPGVQVNRVTLPERSLIQFTLHGRKPGITTLNGRDLATFIPGNPLPSRTTERDLRLTVSVKKNGEARRVAVCYIFDQIHRDKGARANYAALMPEVHQIYFEQANISIINIDGPSASSPLTARTVTITGTMGKVFDLLDKKLLGRVIDAIESKFPGLFDQVDTVVTSVPALLRMPKAKKAEDRNAKVLAVNIKFTRAKDKKRVNLTLVGPQALQRATRGGEQTPAQILLQTIAHELGHGFGLEHHPVEEATNLPPIFKDKKTKTIDPFFFSASSQNLMFPTTGLPSGSLNGIQVEQLHTIRPAFRELQHLTRKGVRQCH